MLKSFVNLIAAAAFIAAAPALAQVQTIDPNQADTWQAEPSAEAPDAAPETWNEEAATGSEWAPAEPQDAVEAAPLEESATETAAAPAAATPTVPREDVFTAAEDVFGRGAEGLAGILENVLRDQGEPVAYISGQEAGGAFVFGVRYGSGTMHHQVEGDRAVYWTGPSVGFDFGADANKVFVLVYNLHDSQRLFRRYPGAEGNAYFVGGFTAQYLRRGDVVLIPIRLGVGMRLGVNAGYMRFSERNRWLPF
ncbi:MAG TPA: DUF1134 domain-containing protein [Allosphingosinicella sp.]|nr:DUF1134 domain-containing protein [Allosphingosinicella sp.]